MERLSWDDYFLKEIVPAVAKRATCDRGRSGAIIVKDKRILTTGYVGSPSGLPHCDDVGHLIHEVIDENGVKSKHCVRTLHAEENAILQAAKFGISIEGATIYCSMVPCFRCAMKIIQVGIKRVVALYDYQKSERTKEEFNEVSIELIIYNNQIKQYDNE